MPFGVPKSPSSFVIRASFVIGTSTFGLLGGTTRLSRRLSACYSYGVLRWEEATGRRLDRPSRRHECFFLKRPFFPCFGPISGSREQTSGSRPRFTACPLRRATDRWRFITSSLARCVLGSPSAVFHFARRFLFDRGFRLRPSRTLPPSPLRLPHPARPSGRSRAVSVFVSRKIFE